MKWIANFSRIVIGVVFVFSGFVKGVDPLGTAYRIEDYFVAYGIGWAEPIALSLSVLLCVFEFSLGVLLLLNVRPKLVSWATLLIMLYFTVITLYDALYEPVPDCGCFGDAIKLTNWQTFYKNIVLIVLAVLLFMYRKRFRTPWSTGTGLILLVIVPVTFGWFSMYNYRNLPLVDFTAWKTGNKMIPDSLEPARFYLVYQHKATGERREYLSKDLPWQDSAWLQQWEFVNQRVEDPNNYPAPNFKIIDSSGNDLTVGYLQAEGYLFFIVSPDLNASGIAELSRVNELYNALLETGYNVIGLTGTPAEEALEINALNKIEIPWFQCDDTELKTMVRSNPGLVVMKDARVLKKWHYRNLPDIVMISGDFPVKTN